MLPFKLSIDKHCYFVSLLLLHIIMAVLLCDVNASNRNSSMLPIQRRTISYYTKKVCFQMANTLRARHKSCFLRPDTGPCRADIIQWYFDVKQAKCYRFFWGGCQGNGNKFETKEQCEKHCILEKNAYPVKIPFYCDIAFDYGSCFGYFNRWGWDKLSQSCRRRLYSGCGGNQNNFETKAACITTCARAPTHQASKMNTLTTCIPVDMLV